MDYDYVVVGAGFGGSVAALRLAEKGYRVALLEAGRRYERGQFAKTNWHLRRYLWAPAIGCYGIQRLSFLGDLIALSGAGVGGGSLVYAGTMAVPPPAFFEDPEWSDLDDDWQRTLAPFYAVARKMLGAAVNPRLWRADEALQEYARELGREEYFAPTEVAAFFGEAGVEVADPYFGGEGPGRTGCTHHGRCMIGCNDGGKNSLDRNYLHLAQRRGAVVFSDTTVTDIVDVGDGYEVHSRRTSGLLSRPRCVRRTAGVVLAAGALGTTRLLLHCRERGHLPRLSRTLGLRVRSCNETMGAVLADTGTHDLSRGVAVTSTLQVDEATTVRPVRYPRGSGLLLMLMTLLVDGEHRAWRPLRWLLACLSQPAQFLRTLWPFGRAERTVINLAIQSHDTRFELDLKRRWYWPLQKLLTSKCRNGELPSYISAGNRATRALAARINGIPLNMFSDVALGIPITAHVLGGCCMGKNAEHGVIDHKNRVFGYRNMYVVDGSAISANVRTVPSLTITALAEYAMSRIPPRTT